MTSTRQDDAVCHSAADSTCWTPYDRIKGQILIEFDSSFVL